MIRSFLWGLVTAVGLGGCNSAPQVKLTSDNGQLSLTYTCTETGPEPLHTGTADLVRSVVLEENAAHILAVTNPRSEVPEAVAVRHAIERRERPALETSVAAYLCKHGHPPARPPRFPEPGSEPPNFEISPLSGEDSLGSAVQLADLRGRTVVLVFWSTWCTGCREEYQELQKLSRRNETEAISTFAIVHADTKKNIRRWQQEHGAEVVFLNDAGERIARSYGVYGIPYTVVIRPNGRIHVAGHVNRNTLQRVVSAAAEFGDPPSARTPQ